VDGILLLLARFPHREFRFGGTLLFVELIEHERSFIAPVHVAGFELEDRAVDRVGEANLEDFVTDEGVVGRFEAAEVLGEFGIGGAAEFDHVGEQIALPHEHEHMMRQLLGPVLFFAEDRAKLGELVGLPLADEGFDGKAVELCGAWGREMVASQEVGEHLRQAAAELRAADEVFPVARLVQRFGIGA